LWEYQEQNAYSGQCVDVAYNSNRNGTPAVQYPCNANDRAERAMWYGGSRFQMDNGLCLDLPGNNQYNLAPLQFYQCNDTGAQHWVFG
jgi:hypothetical protein